MLQRNVDLDRNELRVTISKSDAGLRTVVIHPELQKELVARLSARRNEDGRMSGFGAGSRHWAESRERIREALLRRWGPLEHGTHRMYKNHGCRCPECKTGWAAYRRERKAARQS